MQFVVRIVAFSLINGILQLGIRVAVLSRYPESHENEKTNNACFPKLYANFHINEIELASLTENLQRC